MTVTINARSLFGFVAGLAVAVLALFMFQTMRADAVGSDEATFVPITPCRLLDTRPGDVNIGPRNTPLAENTPHSLQVTGSNGRCVIPAKATAVAINLTGVGATSPTFVAIFPDDAPNPGTSALNILPGQAPTPNKVDVKLSADGKVKLFNRFGTIHIVGDVLGYYRHDGLAGLESQVASLQAEVVALKTKTASMSAETVGGHATVRFSGVNVQVVNGTGETGCSDAGTPCNGLGNLIVGYNEDGGVTEPRSGSHNIVAGIDNDWISHSGIVVGRDHIIHGLGSAAIGGRANRATGDGASILGGFDNLASGDDSSVSGGTSNKATGLRASVSGGLTGSAGGENATISGGSSNSAGGDASSVSGGNLNAANGENAAISGGFFNTAGSSASSVSGGNNNTASASHAVVSGGSGNVAGGASSSVAGGDGNTAGGDFAVVVGGFGNQASGPRAVVAGGDLNVASGSKSVVSGGNQRSSTGTHDWRAGTLFETE